MRLTEFALSALIISSVSPVIAEDLMDFQNLLSGISDGLNQNTTTGATKKMESPLSAPSIVKVYTQKDIEKFDSIYDLLRTVPGVHVENGYFGRQYINIRNVNNSIYNLKTLFLVNGVKVNDPVGPHFNLDTIPKESIKRLEIIRGPGSVLYGSSAFSGVINVETFDSKGYEKNSANFTLGSAGVYGTNANVFERREESGHFFSLRIFGEDGTDRAKSGDYTYHRNLPNGYNNLLTGGTLYRSFPTTPSDYRLDYDNYSFLGVSDFKNLKISYGTSRVRRNASYMDGTNVPFWGGIFAAARQIGPVPGNRLFRPPVLPIPPSFNESLNIRSDNNQEQDWIGLDYRRKLSAKSNLKVLAKFVDSVEEVREYDLNLFSIDSEGRAFEFEVQADRQINDRWNVILGYSREEITFSQRTYGANVNAAALIFTGAPIPSNEFFNITPGSLVLDGIYLQSIYKVSDKLSFLAANRYNQHEIVGSGYSPKYALTYELGKDEFLKVIWGKAFRYPSPFELYVNIPTVAFRGTTNMREEKVESLEYNWVKSWQDGRKNASVTYYDMELTDLIGSTAVNYVNFAGLIKASGWELEWDQKLSDRLGWYSNLSFMSYEDPGSRNSHVGGTLEFKAAIGVDFQWKPNLQVYSKTQWIGEREEANAVPLPNQPEVFVHDVGIVYKHNDDHRIRMDVLNVFDEDYRTLNYSVNMPKMMTPPRGRRVQLSYQIQF